MLPLCIILPSGHPFPPPWAPDVVNGTVRVSGRRLRRWQRRPSKGQLPAALLRLACRRGLRVGLFRARAHLGRLRGVAASAGLHRPRPAPGAGADGGPAQHEISHRLWPASAGAQAPRRPRRLLGGALGPRGECGERLRGAGGRDVAGVHGGTFGLPGHGGGHVRLCRLALPLPRQGAARGAPRPRGGALCAGRVGRRARDGEAGDRQSRPLSIWRPPLRSFCAPGVAA
mmetsp:Transcript_150375/g.481251  ORF Transcript_150375/g.481251 Transcript_150375/m.481251 type:complete len:229 (+) Transcript_150375:78-764(+)